MIPRAHVQQLSPGRCKLVADEAHHIRDVLRLQAGDEIEMFDDAGRSAVCKIEQSDRDGVFVTVGDGEVKLIASIGVSITVASAVPKGDRADWMIEKLSELGVARFVPLITARSVVLPVGKNKRERWQRTAKESAKQSRRSGVMQIDELTPLSDAIASGTASGVGSAQFFLSTEPSAEPIARCVASKSPLKLYIGPEGGWTDDEIKLMRQANMSGLKLTSTILRTETAAIVAAAVASALSNGLGNANERP